MTYIHGVRLRVAMLVGACAGVGAGLVFATAHALLIVPIWNRMAGGLAFGALAGAVGGWTFAELYAREAADRLPRAAAAGARYGALLWLAVSPVSAVDALLRVTGVVPRYEWLGVVVALTIATATGSVLGWYRRHNRRGMIAGAAAVVLMTLAMAGPVPIGRNARALGIFLAVLPAAIIAGTIIASAIALARPRVRAAPPPVMAS